jgi:RNA polymerase sigma-70 factor (ECF subfamily)
MSPPPADDDLTAKLVRNLQSSREVEKSARLLVERYSTQVARFFTRKGVPASLVEDLTQDTFLRVFHKIGSLRYDYNASFVAWLLEIERNLFSNWLRSAGAKKRDVPTVSLSSEQDEYAGRSPEAWLTADEPDPLEQLIKREREEKFHEAIAKLSEQRRRACELRYLFGLKYREIAAVMNISIETVKAHLHQARAVLEEAFRVTDWTPVGSELREDEEET